MANPVQYQAKEVLNKVLNTDGDALNVDLHDVTLTTEGGDVAIDVELSNATDDVLVYGFDGSANQKIATDSSGQLQVDILTSALPSGAATAANQATIIGHVDGIEALLTTIDADTDAIKTAVEIIDNAISGSEMQVDIVSDGAGLATSANQSTANTHLGNLFYDTALAVTPSDVADLSGEPYYAVWVGTGGDLKVDMADGGAAVILSNCASGQLIPIMVERIYSTGTTASNIIAFK